jgi:3-oxoadipate enol-lactonase/4-carboxymuconolactone decarboxylase
MPFASHDGARIYWRLQGARGKPVLVLLNSIGLDQSLFDAVAPDLVSDFRLLRLDTRGHGASDAPPGDYTLDLLADDILAVMDAAGVESACVCGVSLGGMMAMKLALKAPERVDGLVLACTSAHMDAEFWRQRVATVRQEGLGVVVEAALGRLFSEPFAGEDPATVDTVRTGLLTMSPDGYAGCGAAILHMNLLAQLPAVTAPTLVVGAALDTAAPHEGHGDRIAAAIPGARSVVLSCGHLACLEAPDAFVAAVRDLGAMSQVAGERNDPQA